MQSLQEAWDHLARIIERHSPELVLAELFNEPDIDPARWQIEADRLAKFVRERLPRTTLVVGPTNWQRADSLPDFRPLSDPNVVYAIHFYDPMVFTHQGHWDAADPLSPYSGVALSNSGRRRGREEYQAAIDRRRKSARPENAG
jgi:endoglucanase